MAKEVAGQDIPRRKGQNGKEAGPLVYPPGAKFISGNKKCESCGRMVRTDRAFPRKGSCKCLYYRRTTTFIDVMQDEYLLKQWGNRNVAWGMAARPDLVLHAIACGPPHEIVAGSEDYRELNQIAAEAQRTAGDMIKATVGTSLHKMTHSLDRGRDIVGPIPERWEKDLEVYQQAVKLRGIEWVSIESFRVLDKWVKDLSECDHKPVRYGGKCTCFGVAGTVDRIGWWNGRLMIFDIKTGSDFNKLGHAMQLAAYAHMVPYLFPGDERTVEEQVDLDVGYIIKLPEGQGRCEFEPMDLRKGWEACQIAKRIWEARDWNVVLERDLIGEVTDMASRAGSLLECRMLWNAAKENGDLIPVVKTMINGRVKELKAQGVTS